MSGFISAIQEGGPWMAPIIISFVFAMAIVVERFMVLLGAKSNQKAVMATVKKAIMSNNFDSAIRECEGLAQKKQALPAVLAAGLKKASNPGKGMQDMEGALEQETLKVFPRLTKRMAFLPMLANVATLSGLLGTIIGLIDSFAALGNANIDPSQKQTLLAAGISKAMYTTAGGLVVAIPTLVLNSILTSMLSNIMDQIDQSAAEVLNETRANRSTKAAK
jgi:biopolymer transport protein ExbB/TolQ